MTISKLPPDSNEYYGINQKRLTEDHFNKMVTYLSKKYGLRIPHEKKTMLESRLSKRLNTLKINNFNDYLKHVFEYKSDEYTHFIDLVTTHKTSFFREDYQFSYLTQILPELYSKRSSNERFNVWSAGCSTGEEVYTLGMVLNEFRLQHSSFDYKIIGTDISKPSLQKAASGVYSMNEIKDIPANLRDKYFSLAGNSHEPKMYFNDNSIVARIKLGSLNLNNAAYKLPPSFDVIFCRNVIIYFDIETQKRVLQKMINHLKPGGLLFLGHSETAIGTQLPIRSIRPTIYQKLS